MGQREREERDDQRDRAEDPGQGEHQEAAEEELGREQVEDIRAQEAGQRLERRGVVGPEVADGLTRRSPPFLDLRTHGFDALVDAVRDALLGRLRQYSGPKPRHVRVSAGDADPVASREDPWPHRQSPT